ncbi:MAG: TadE/TadG family type IV pilus assembly protein [Thermoguttaceae bacterium]
MLSGRRCSRRPDKPRGNDEASRLRAEAVRGAGRRRIGAGRRGTTLVEFALVVPVVFVFVFGMIELSRYVMVQQALSSAAQRGCRTAALATTLSSSEVDTAVRETLVGSLGPVANSGSVRITLSPSDLTSVASGTQVSVRVEVDTSDISWVRGTTFGRARDVVLAGQSTLARE